MATKTKETVTKEPGAAPETLPASEGTALATQQDNVVELHGKTRPGNVAGYDVGDVGTGFEDFTQDDVAVPFIGILQKNSPQVEEENPKYLPGAKPSMLFNTVTNELFEGKTKGINVIPVHRVRTYIEWIPKDDGGGLVAVYEPNDPAVMAVLKKAGKKFGKLKINDNNDLVETFNIFCLLLRDSGATERIVISMASSQIGGYKKWMTMAQSIQLPSLTDPDRMVVPPLFSHVYKLTTFFFQKKENTWFKWLAAFANEDAEKSRLAPDSPLYEAAREFRTLVTSGRATANFEGAVQDAEVVESEYEM